MTETPKTNSAVSRWKKLGQPQPITLPSGMKVDIQVPDVGEMLRNGDVPNELIQHANEAQDEASPGGFDMEKVKEATDYMRWLISATVKNPEVTPDEVPDLPVFDRDMILEFALRQRDVDAVGHQLFGMEKLAEWRRFRRGDAID